MEQVRTAPDEEAAVPFLQDAQRIVERELPLIPVLFQNDLGVHSERLVP